MPLRPCDPRCRRGREIVIEAGWEKRDKIVAKINVSVLKITKAQAAVAKAKNTGMIKSISTAKPTSRSNPMNPENPESNANGAK